MLDALEVFDEVVALRDKFPQDIDDVVLFDALKGSEYVFVTHDHKQKTRRSETEALIESGMTSLWLGPFWKKLTFWGEAKWIVSHWETIDGYVRGVAVGTSAEVQQNGKSRPFKMS